MAGQASALWPSTEARARLSLGSSGAAVYRMVARALASRNPSGGLLLDAGCGAGNLWRAVGRSFDRYVGLDVARYDGFPADGEFVNADLDKPPIPLPDGSADVAAAVESIHLLENPRALVRELVRLTKPGGLVIVTTPNQLSLLNKLSFVVKNQFIAFQEAPGLYPAHRTALLESDLLRIANECRLKDSTIHYSDEGRMPLTSLHWPSWCKGRAFSDNLMLIARKDW